jgi:NADH-quinone oxidoreductase subunit J
MLTEYAFWFLTFVALFSAIGMIISKNPVYSVLSLIVTFFAIAGHYFLLNAQFLAAVHIIVYAGAIMVLLVVISAAIAHGQSQQTAIAAASNFGTTETLGLSLYKDFLIPFEISSVLFLSAMVGAVYLSKKEQYN